MSTERNTKRTKRDEKALDTRLMTVGELLARQNIAEISDEAYSEKKMPLFFRYKLERDLRKAVAKAQAERKAELLRKNDPEPFSPCGKQTGRSLSSVGFKRAIAILITAIIFSTFITTSVSSYYYKKDQFNLIPDKDFDRVVFYMENAPKTVEQRKEPRYTPGAYERSVLTDGPIVYIVQYMLNGGGELQYFQWAIDKQGFFIDNKDVKTKDIDINGCVGMVYTLKDKKCNYVLWSDRVYMYVVSANFGVLTLEELIKVAESVQIEKR